MKLIRFGLPEYEKPGIILDDGTWGDVSGFGEDYNEVFFSTDGLNRLKKWLSKNILEIPRIKPDTRLGSPICRPSKIICIGLNYRSHIDEIKSKIPREPILFYKSTTAIVGHNDPLVLPKNGLKVDWEVELAVIIGKKASYVNEEKAGNYIAGYSLINDYSERAFQLEHKGQWLKGKSCDTFAPLGPYLLTTDDMPEVTNLNIWLSVNGERKQDSNTEKMIFKIPFLVHYISQFMTLLPGDIIATGTPSGVGMSQDPPQFLKSNDIVEYGIDQLGYSRQKVVIKSFIK